MSLKEELAKLEKEEIEEEQDEIELIRREETADKITGLYRRIEVIAEYIDNQKGVTTITEQQLKEDERHFREEGIRKAWELKNLEPELKIKDYERGGIDLKIDGQDEVGTNVLRYRVPLSMKSKKNKLKPCWFCGAKGFYWKGDCKLWLCPICLGKRVALDLDAWMKSRGYVE